MRKRRRKYVLPKNLLLCLVLLFFGMGVGYAAIADQFSVAATSHFKETHWNIIFGSFTRTAGSVDSGSISINNNNTITLTDVVLESPGDYFDFTVDIDNNGTLDAKLDSIVTTPDLDGALSNYFSYSVKYSDGRTINIGDALNAGDSVTIRVRLEYVELQDVNLYPTQNETISFNLTMNYVQGMGNAVGSDDDEEETYTV